MALNPNYPVIEELWGPMWGAAGAGLPAGRMVNNVERTIAGATIRRGKQYELDQAQAGEYQVTLGTQDGALDPTNAAGPYGGNILPYQPYRRRAQWPPTPNLLTQIQASGGEGFSAGAIPASFNIKSTADASGGTVAVPSGSLTAFQGTNTFRFGLTSGTGSGTRICFTDGVGVAPGKQFTVSMRIRCITASTSVSVKGMLGFYGSDSSASPVTFNYGSVTALTGSATANTWTTVTATATAPTTGGVYGMCVGVSTGATVAANCTVEIDSWQLERGPSASAWTLPGVWYPLFSGFTERWPTLWAEGGTYGQVTPTAVDAFALLSQVTLGDVFREEIDSLNPRFCYPLDDPAGSRSFVDSTGTHNNANAVDAKTGSGNWTAGNAIVAASPSGVFTGSTGTVVTSSPLTPGSASVTPATVLSLSGAPGIAGPVDGGSGWTRMIAFRYTAGTNPTDIALLWDCHNGNGGPFDSQAKVYIGGGGALTHVLSAQAADSSFERASFGPATVTDGNWHLAIWGVDGVNTQRTSLDGSIISSTVSPSGIPSLGGLRDYVGAAYDPTLRNATDVFKGDIAFVTEFPRLLSAAEMTGLTSAWRSSASGESSDARYARILKYAGYKGPTNLGTGVTTAMGPATDLAGADVMTALTNVVTTENGNHFVAGDGTVTFQGRGARYNALTPSLVFGDGPGELPYEDLQLDFDSTHLSNVVEVTHQASGQTFPSSDSASIAAYYTRTMTRTLNTANPLECQDASAYLLSRYKGPLTRVQSLKVHPAAAPALWPSLLALELGTRVTVNRRPPGAPLVTVDCFVEQISWDMDDNGEAWCTIQCSPVDLNPYAALGAFHTTLNTAVSAGASSMTLNAGADNLNPLAAQLPKGTPLVVGLGTANQEVVTLGAVGVTTSGWATSACGISGTFSKAHSVGDIVCEVLPSGVTNPAFYDGTEQFGKAVFAY